MKNFFFLKTILLSIIFSNSIFSSVNEDYEILRDVFGAYPYPYHPKCSAISSCPGGLSPYPDNPPDFAPHVTESIRFLNLRDKREYEDGGVIFYWDQTNGLDFDDYKKYCEVENTEQKKIGLKRIFIEKYNYETKTCGNTVYGCSFFNAPLESSRANNIKNIGWKKSAKKILASDNIKFSEVIKKQKFKNPFFSIQGKYSYKEHSIDAANKEPLLETEFFCDMEDRVYEYNIYGEYNNSRTVVTKKLIRTPVKNWVREEILALKKKKKEELLLDFNSMENFQTANEIRILELGRSGIKEPKLDKENFETCEEFIPRVIDYWKSIKKTAYAKIKLNYNNESEHLYFSFDSASRNINKDCWMCNFGKGIKLPRSSYDMEAVVIEGNKTKMAVLTKDNELPHIIDFTLYPLLNPQFIPYKRNLAKENFKNLEAYILFEYFDKKGSCNSENCRIYPHKINGYAIKNRETGELVYLAPNNIGLKAKRLIDPKGYSACSIYTIQDYIDMKITPDMIIKNESS